MIDQGLSTNDVRRAAAVLRSTPAELRAMMHASPTKVLAPTTLLLQLCLICRANHQAMTRAPVSIRAWFELWSVECDHCSTPFSPPGPPRLDRVNPAREEFVWFESIRNAARAGARKLADFARRPFMTGWSPMILLRLLSMRLSAGVVQDEIWRTNLTNRRLAECAVPGELAERQPHPGALDGQATRPAGNRQDDTVRRHGGGVQEPSCHLRLALGLCTWCQEPRVPPTRPQPQQPTTASLTVTVNVRLRASQISR